MALAQGGDGTEDALTALSRAATLAGRDDLAARTSAALARLGRALTVVCVVGEFKQGKSLLVNALLGRPICPVDDDLATSAVTIVQYAPTTEVVVLHHEGNDVARRSIHPSELRDWVTEAGNPGNVRRVEQIVIGLDHPLLADGLAIVDTPGVGGVGAGHAAATLAFLPYADALLFVSDATAELSAPELEFLAQATERCPHVWHVLTKTDLQPAWRRIADLDRAHLQAAAPGVPGIPVSAAAAVAALERGDDALAAESGIPALRDRLRSEVLDRARVRARQRARTDARSIAAVLGGAARRELDLLGAPADDEQQRQLDEAVTRLEQLRGAGARWPTVLGDRMGDLSNRASYQFRSGLRDLGIRMDEAIEELSSPKAWDELARTLQTEVATVVADVFGSLESGIEDLRTELAELLAVEVGDLGADRPLPDGDELGHTLDDIWAARLRDPQETTAARKAAAGAMQSLRGAQSGILLFGMLGNFLPTAAATLLFSNPVMLVLGAGFAGKQAIEVRRRNVAQRRQQARTAVRQFVDDVQFELTNRLSDEIRRRQRELRDEVTERLNELARTWTDLANAARDDVSRSAAERAAREAQLRDRLALVDGALATLGMEASP